MHSRSWKGMNGGEGGRWKPWRSRCIDSTQKFLRVPATRRRLHVLLSRFATPLTRSQSTQTISKFVASLACVSSWIRLALEKFIALGARLGVCSRINRPMNWVSSSSVTRTECIPFELPYSVSFYFFWFLIFFFVSFLFFFHLSPF